MSNGLHTGLIVRQDDVPRNAVGLAVNTAHSRSQNQFHIHIECLRQDVYDSLRAIDYLVSRPDIDTDRLGTIGLSMGSTMAWWVAALDTRIKICIDLCCLTDFQALIDSKGLDGHGLYYFVPSLLKHFSAAQINALIAPRPHLSLAGNYDPLTPPQGLDRIDQELKRAYKDSGNEAGWQLKRSETGHFETSTMRFTIVDFLSKWL